MDQIRGGGDVLEHRYLCGHKNRKQITKIYYDILRHHICPTPHRKVYYLFICEISNYRERIFPSLAYYQAMIVLILLYHLC